LDAQKAAKATKIHVQAEGMGKPMQFTLTEGQRSDVKGFGILNSTLKVKRALARETKATPSLFGG
jgi:hypothetical protein